MHSKPDETWRSAFQTAAKDLAVGRDRPFAEFTLERSEGLRVTRYNCSNGQEHFVQIESCLVIYTANDWVLSSTPARSSFS